MAEKPPHIKAVKGHVRKVTCPMCHQPVAVLHTPFCSRRCAQLDLGKWLTGDYAIPAHEAMDDSDVEMLLTAYEAKQADEEG